MPFQWLVHIFIFPEPLRLACDHVFMHVRVFSDGKTRQFSSSALTPKPSSSSSVSSKENGGTSGNSLSPFSLSGKVLEEQRIETYLSFFYYETELMKVFIYRETTVSVHYPLTL